MAKKVYTCQSCGALAEEPGHLCNPNMDPMTCAFCGGKGPSYQALLQGQTGRHQVCLQQMRPAGYLRGFTLRTHQCAAQVNQLFTGKQPL